MNKAIDYLLAITCQNYKLRL